MNKQSDCYEGLDPQGKVRVFCVPFGIHRPLISAPASNLLGAFCDFKYTLETRAAVNWKAVAREMTHPNRKSIDFAQKISYFAHKIILSNPLDTESCYAKLSIV